MAHGRSHRLAGHPSRPGPFLFTCEHASNFVPEHLSPSDRDRQRLEEHWGYDLGAAWVTTELTRLLGGEAVLCAFSRLVIDTNRTLDAASLIPTHIDDEPVDFNAGLHADERARRVGELWEGYHHAVSDAIARRRDHGTAFHLISIHSFTPVYRGQTREMDIGVLFDEHEREAEELARALSSEAFSVALNEPYSGRGPDALIYSAQRHGRAGPARYLELEIRHDQILSEANARMVAARIARALAAFAPEDE